MPSNIDARRAVLSDSEATLRQIRSVLSDFGDPDDQDTELEAMVSRIEGHPAGLTELVRLLVTTYAEIMEVIGSLRRSRGLLEEASMERIKSTGMKLAEVSSATETAATGMLDGLDRALNMVDALEGAVGEDGDGDESVHIRSELRDELHQLIGLLQFQDITSQQLGYASSVLADVEERMLRLSNVFGPSGVGVPSFASEESHTTSAMAETAVTCDPNASTHNADTRQAVADEIFMWPQKG